MAGAEVGSGVSSNAGRSSNIANAVAAATTSGYARPLRRASRVRPRPARSVRPRPTTIPKRAGTRYARVARPEEVQAATGFEPGGVAPFPAPGVSQVLMSGELLVHDRVWIGAGSERHMAGISPLDLLRLTNARTAELS